MKIINLFGKELDCFKSISELPINNWQKINSTNDVSWLLRKRRALKENEIKKLRETWYNIFDEFLDAFQIPEFMLNVLLLRRDIEVLKCEFYLTCDKGILLFIEIKEYELEQLNTKDSKDNLSETCAAIAEHIGIRVNPNETTVFEYYGYIKHIENKIASRKKTG